MVDHTDDLTRSEQSLRLRRPGRMTSPRLARRARRLCLAAVTFVITILLVLALGCGLLFLRLSHGSMSVAALDAPVLNALTSRLRPGFKADIQGVDLEAVDGRPAISVNRLLIRDEAGRPIFHAPRAVITIDPLQLLFGAIVPTRLDVRNVVLKLSILPNGALALSAGTGETAPVLISDAVAGMAAGRDEATPDPSADTTGSVRGGATDGTGLSMQSRIANVLADFIDRFSGAGADALALDRLGIDQGTLVLDDRTHDTVMSFRNLDLAFRKLSPTSSRLDVAADGQSGRWAAHLIGTQDTNKSRTLQIDTEGVTLDDLRAVPALREVGIDTDLSLSASISLGLDPAGALTVARGRFTTGAGFLHIHDPDHEPFFVDAIESAFRFDAKRGAILIDTAALKADTTSYQMSGEVTPPAAGGSEWAFALNGRGVFGSERPGEKPIALDRIAIAGRLSPDPGRLAIDTFQIAGPQVDLKLQSTIERTATGVVVKGGAQSGRMPAPIMLRLWPAMLGADVRAWLLMNLQGGMVEQGRISWTLDDNDFAKMRAVRSIADDHLRVDYAVSDVTLGFMTGVPPLKKVSGHGSVTGDTSHFSVDDGTLEVAPGRLLKVADGGITVPSTDPKPAPATITAHIVGPVDVLTELLSRDALKPYADLPSAMSGARGQIDGQLTVGLKIGRGANPKDVKVGATAQIAGLAIDKLVGKQSLTDGQINLVLDKTGLRIKGDAKLFGASTALDVKKPAGTGAGEAVALLTMDDAARAKAGLDLGKQLTGPVTARVAVNIGSDDKPALIDLDLTKTAITNLVPGLSKAAGKPGRVTLAANATANGVTLDNIACDIGSFSLRGQATLDSDGGFQSARLSQVRLSPGDDMRVEATQGGEALKLVVRGTNIDARPFLKNLIASDASSGGTKNVDVELHSGVMTGQNSQALTAVDLRMAKRDGQMRRLQLSGKFGRAPFEIKSSQQGRDLVLNATSADAGATLTFLDLYKKVASGQLDATIRLGDNKFDGFATIHGFSLREDPAMKRLTEEGISQDRKGGLAQIDTSNISFTKLYVIFNKAGTRMNIRDGGMFGPQMGATVQGWIDLGGDKLQLNGTYVPAYGVNNLFSQIPVFGQLLGGDVHEGLFGINYRLTGSIASPNLTVDPLSAIAPGFLRKIFGAISEATQESGAPTVGRQQSLPDTVAR